MSTAKSHFVQVTPFAGAHVRQFSKAKQSRRNWASVHGRFSAGPTTEGSPATKSTHASCSLMKQKFWHSLKAHAFPMHTTAGRFTRGRSTTENSVDARAWRRRAPGEK